MQRMLVAKNPTAYRQIESNMSVCGLVESCALLLLVLRVVTATSLQR